LSVGRPLLGFSVYFLFDTLYNTDEHYATQEGNEKLKNIPLPQCLYVSPLPCTLASLLICVIVIIIILTLILILIIIVLIEKFERQQLI